MGFIGVGGVDTGNEADWADGANGAGLTVVAGPAGFGGCVTLAVSGLLGVFVLSGAGSFLPGITKSMTTTAASAAAAIHRPGLFCFSIKNYAMKPKSGTAKRPRFGKTYDMLVALTPNHFASVALY